MTSTERTICWFQRGFNYSQDGEGNRLVYHLYGCNYHCPWCANPESMLPNSTMLFKSSVDTLVKAVLSARPMYFDGGGLTLTGGEPTMQFDAVNELLQRVKSCEVNTCMESNASHPRLPELFSCLDLLIADFKHPNSREHERWTGKCNETVCINLRLAIESGMQVLIRTPLIHHVNDTDEALNGFVNFYQPYASRTNFRVEFLRYHEFGKNKWKKLGARYAMEDAFVSQKRVKCFEDTIKAIGISVIET